VWEIKGDSDMKKSVKVFLWIWGLVVVLWASALLADIWQQGLVNGVKDNFVHLLVMPTMIFLVYASSRNQQKYK
jgi:hypothetical protein